MALPRIVIENQNVFSHTPLGFRVGIAPKSKAYRGSLTSPAGALYSAAPVIVTEIESIPFNDPIFTKLFGGGAVVALQNCWSSRSIISIKNS